MTSARHDGDSELESNVRLIPFHEGLTHAAAWLPVFVLFSRARFDLDGALLLASVYYLFVVALEVPSGWMSDRLGRVITLRVAALSWVVAHACFLLGDDRLVVIVVGQFFLAAGYASLSGTDVTFHYDTLEALGRASTFAARQARVASIGYAVTALTAMAGGALGLVDLRLAFALSLGFAVAQLAVTLRLHEPPTTTRAQALGPQLVACLRYLGERYLGWIFFYGVLLVPLEHVAFTVMQPWLTEVVGETADDLGATPLLAGTVYAVTALIGSAAARASAPASERFGLVATLIGLAAVSASIVTSMALSTHLLVLAVAALRSVQGAAAPVLISAAIAPRTRREHRATLLSLNSLAGRLGYGLLLLLVAGAIEDDVRQVLEILSVIAWALVVVLVVTAMWATRPRPSPA